MQTNLAEHQRKLGIRPNRSPEELKHSQGLYAGFSYSQKSHDLHAAGMYLAPVVDLVVEASTMARAPALPDYQHEAARSGIPASSTGSVYGRNNALSVANSGVVGLRPVPTSQSAASQSGSQHASAVATSIARAAVRMVISPLRNAPRPPMHPSSVFNNGGAASAPSSIGFSSGAGGMTSNQKLGAAAPLAGIPTPRSAAKRRQAIFGVLPTEFSSPRTSTAIFGPGAIAAEEARRIQAVLGIGGAAESEAAEGGWPGLGRPADDGIDGRSQDEDAGAAGGGYSARAIPTAAGAAPMQEDEDDGSDGWNVDACAPEPAAAASAAIDAAGGRRSHFDSYEAPAGDRNSAGCRDLAAGIRASAAPTSPAGGGPPEGVDDGMQGADEGLYDDDGDVSEEVEELDTGSSSDGEDDEKDDDEEEEEEDDEEHYQPKATAGANSGSGGSRESSSNNGSADFNDGEGMDAYLMSTQVHADDDADDEDEGDAASSGGATHGHAAESASFGESYARERMQEEQAADSEEALLLSQQLDDHHDFDASADADARGFAVPGAAAAAPQPPAAAAPSSTFAGVPGQMQDGAPTAVAAAIRPSSAASAAAATSMPRVTGPAIPSLSPHQSLLIDQATSEVFKYRSLRPGQRVAINAAVAGQDLMLILPTGGGKSTCFAMPALFVPGLTIVISPLVSLMQTQAQLMQERYGIPSLALYHGSTTTTANMYSAHSNAGSGEDGGADMQAMKSALLLISRMVNTCDPVKCNGPATTGPTPTAVIGGGVGSGNGSTVPSSSSSAHQQQQHQNRVHNWTWHEPLKLLFISPERLIASKALLQALQRLSAKGLLARLVVDEAHCVTEWGLNFRPAFSELCWWRKAFPSVPVTVMTATAPPMTVSGIFEKLRMDPQHTVIVNDSGDRSNLHYVVINTPRGNNDKLFAKVVDIVQKRDADRVREQQKQQHASAPAAATATATPAAAAASFLQSADTGIIFCHKQRTCEDLARALQRAGISADFYHSTVTEGQRKSRLDAWMAGKIRIMCATIAFGMGIDHPHVRFIIHTSIPKSLASYAQESGRAGRDGLPSTCILLWDPADVSDTCGYLARDLRCGLEEISRGGTGFGDQFRMAGASDLGFNNGGGLVAAPPGGTNSNHAWGTSSAASGAGAASAMIATVAQQAIHANDPRCCNYLQAIAEVEEDRKQWMASQQSSQQSQQLQPQRQPNAAVPAPSSFPAAYRPAPGASSAPSSFGRPILQNAPLQNPSSFSRPAAGTAPPKPQPTYDVVSALDRIVQRNALARIQEPRSTLEMKLHKSITLQSEALLEMARWASDGISCRRASLNRYLQTGKAFDPDRVPGLHLELSDAMKGLLLTASTGAVAGSADAAGSGEPSTATLSDLVKALPFAPRCCDHCDYTRLVWLGSHLPVIAGKQADTLRSLAIMDHLSAVPTGLLHAARSDVSSGADHHATAGMLVNRTAADGAGALGMPSFTQINVTVAAAAASAAGLQAAHFHLHATSEFEEGGESDAHAMQASMAAPASSSSALELFGKPIVSLKGKKGAAASAAAAAAAPSSDGPGADLAVSAATSTTGSRVAAVTIPLHIPACAAGSVLLDVTAHVRLILNEACGNTSTAINANADSNAARPGQGATMIQIIKGCRRAIRAKDLEAENERKAEVARMQELVGSSMAGAVGFRGSNDGSGGRFSGHGQWQHGGRTGGDVGSAVNEVDEYDAHGEWIGTRVGASTAAAGGGFNAQGRGLTLADLDGADGASMPVHASARSRHQQRSACSLGTSAIAGQLHDLPEALWARIVETMAGRQLLIRDVKVVSKGGPSSSSSSSDRGEMLYIGVYKPHVSILEAVQRKKHAVLMQQRQEAMRREQVQMHQRYGGDYRDGGYGHYGGCGASSMHMNHGGGSSSVQLPDIQADLPADQSPFLVRVRVVETGAVLKPLCALHLDDDDSSGCKKTANKSRKSSAGGGADDNGASGVSSGKRSAKTGKGNAKKGRLSTSSSSRRRSGNGPAFDENGDPVPSSRPAMVVVPVEICKPKQPSPPPKTADGSTVKQFGLFARSAWINADTQKAMLLGPKAAKKAAEEEKKRAEKEAERKKKEEEKEIERRRRDEEREATRLRERQEREAKEAAAREKKELERLAREALKAAEDAERQRLAELRRQEKEQRERQKAEERAQAAAAEHSAASSTGGKKSSKAARSSSGAASSGGARASVGGQTGMRAFLHTSAVQQLHRCEESSILPAASGAACTPGPLASGALEQQLLQHHGYPGDLMPNRMLPLPSPSSSPADARLQADDDMHFFQQQRHRDHHHDARDTAAQDQLEGDGVHHDGGEDIGDDDDVTMADLAARQPAAATRGVQDENVPPPASSSSAAASAFASSSGPVTSAVGAKRGAPGSGASSAASSASSTSKVAGAANAGAQLHQRRANKIPANAVPSGFSPAPVGKLSAAGTSAPLSSSYAFARQRIATSPIRTFAPSVSAVTGIRDATTQVAAALPVASSIPAAAADAGAGAAAAAAIMSPRCSHGNRADCGQCREVLRLAAAQRRMAKAAQLQANKSRVEV